MQQYCKESKRMINTDFRRVVSSGRGERQMRGNKKGTCRLIQRYRDDLVLRLSHKVTGYLLLCCSIHNLCIVILSHTKVLDNLKIQP